MKKPIVPITMIIVGYGLLAACIALLLTTTLSDNAHMWAIIGESFGVGLGSAGLGALIATPRR